MGRLLRRHREHGLEHSLGIERPIDVEPRLDLVLDTAIIAFEPRWHPSRHVDGEGIGELPGAEDTFREHHLQRGAEEVPDDDPSVLSRAIACPRRHDVREVDVPGSGNRLWDVDLERTLETPSGEYDAVGDENPKGAVGEEHGRSLPSRLAGDYSGRSSRSAAPQATAQRPRAWPRPVRAPPRSSPRARPMDACQNGRSASITSARGVRRRLVLTPPRLSSCVGSAAPRAFPAKQTSRAWTSVLKRFTPSFS